MEFEKMKEVIANVLNVDPEEIKLETTFTEDLGADSLDLFQIIMGLEDEFDVQIDPEKTENITTVGEAVELLKSAIANWEAKNPEQSKELDNGNVIVKSIMVGPGRTLKRIRPCPQGRAGRIRKRSNHVTIVLDVKPQAVEE